MPIKSSTNDMKYEDFIFTAVEVNDTFNAEVVGPNQSYCLDNSCVFPRVKVLGIPGNYTISLVVKITGYYDKIHSDRINIELEILECDIDKYESKDEDKYVYQYVEESTFKSCYKPKCDHSCNKGRCVNNNVCDCEGTHLTGQYCDEYLKLKRIEGFDLTFTFLAIILIIVSIIILDLLYMCRNHPNIKGGMSKKKMYSIIVLITIYHWIVTFIWLCFDFVNIQDTYTTTYEKYQKCQYPPFKNIR
ncbi:hypothetical protein PIROE2DRAFT_11149 [Piromyces sp. E2]|nr:hypothetical protein PIROE2DRAFT_11149 [Piromyces sp. E2]|eukprot:OUM62515.1 hypothetical protein PIROE2DRAFT_11149 [Piromyces sp. E2]